MSGTAREFAFGGRLALDLTWTLRYRAVAPTELLATPADLRRWIGRAVAPVRGVVAPELLTEAIVLREAVYNAASAIVDGLTVRAVDRHTINRWAARPGPGLRLDPAGTAVVVLSPGAEPEHALAAVAQDAVALFAAHNGRLRRCEGPGCSLLFHDASRPGRRRWCAAERCGNRVNTATYRQRRNDSPSSP